MGFALYVFLLFVSFFRLGLGFVPLVFVWALLCGLCPLNNNSQRKKKGIGGKSFIDIESNPIENLDNLITSKNLQWPNESLSFKDVKTFFTLNPHGKPIFYFT